MPTGSAARQSWVFNTVDLVNQLEAEARIGKTGQLAGQLVRADLVVFDSCGVGSYVELLEFDGGFAWLPANLASGDST
jgi:hypothetical protein